MHRTGPWTLLFVLITLQLGQAQTVDFVTLPRDSEIVARNESNIGKIKIEGVESAGGFQFIRIQVYKDGADYSSSSIDLDYSSGSANFLAEVEIDAGLFNYKIDVFISDGNAEQLLQSINDLSAGDLYFINGQSNAESKSYSGSANHNTHPFIRTLSSGGLWLQALGDDSALDSFVGQWPLRMGRQFIERFQIPVGLVNGAEGGRPITYFHKNDSNPIDSATNYGRALRRLSQGGLENSIKAIFWYQGEFDKQGNISPEDYISHFDEIYEDWREDYPDIERIYVFQIRQGCGSQAANGVQEAQRRIDHIYPEVVLITTTGIDGHDGCHFGYNHGYETIGDRVSFLLGQDLYGEPKTNFFSPTPQSLFYSNDTRSQITITTQNPSDQLVFDSGSETYFSFSDRSIFATSGSAGGNNVVLNLNKPATDGLSVSYEGHSGPGSWVSSEKGIGLATFSQLPISVDVDNEFVESPLLDFEVELYPQPSTGLSTLTLESSVSDLVKVRVYDTLGRLVENLEIQILGNERRSIELDLSDLPIGKYFLNLRGTVINKHLSYIRK